MLDLKFTSWRARREKKRALLTKFIKGAMEYFSCESFLCLRVGNLPTKWFCSGGERNENIHEFIREI